MTIDFDSLKARLYTAVLSDTLDGLGRRTQTMRPFIRPLSDESTLFGPVRTGLFLPRDAVAEGENPYEVEIALIDDLAPGDIPVFGCNGPTETIAPWGELLTTAAIARGATGFVTDGLVRDVRAIRAAGFPVFHGGIGPLDSAGRCKMTEPDIAIDCGGVRVHPGDLVFADVDGVVVIPSELIGPVLDGAMAKIDGENRTRDEIRAWAMLADVYARYGVL
jgi:regulator of RNase E activity RraA